MRASPPQTHSGYLRVEMAYIHCVVHGHLQLERGEGLAEASRGGGLARMLNAARDSFVDTIA